MKAVALVWTGLLVPLNVALGVVTGDIKSFIVAGACALAFVWVCTA